MPTEVTLSPAADVFFSEVEAVYLAMRGTPEQVARAETIQQQGEQRDYSACMRTAGFQYDVPTVNWIHVQRRAYEPSWWARPSMADAARGFGYATPYEPDAASSETGGATSYNLLSDDEKASYDQALNTCGQTAVTEGNAASAQMDKARVLERSMRTAMIAATTVKGFSVIQATYAACMSEAGIPVSVPGNLYELAEAAAEKTKIGKYDIRSAEYAALLPEALEAEVAIARSDVSCRATIADDTALLLQPTLTTWVAANQRQVDTVEKGWAVFDR